MNGNDGCIIFVGLILIASAFIALGCVYCRDHGFKEGYTQALTDIEAKKEPKYKLIKKENGETKWVEVNR